MLVAQHDLLVQLGVGLVHFDAHPGAQVELLVLQQQVVVEVQALLAGELFPEVDPELVSLRCCGASCSGGTGCRSRTS